jgi:hypothetical protein
VNHDTFVENDDIHRGCTDVAHADAELPFIGLQHGIGRSQRLVHSIFHVDASTVHHGNDVLDGTGGRCDDVRMDSELTTYHSDRKAGAILFIEDKVLGKQVQNLAVFRKRCCLRGLCRLADVFEGDFSRA